MQALSIHCSLLLASICVWHYVNANAPKGLIQSFGIYGGKPVKITEVPFMAMLRPKDAPWGCGAVIINEQFLLSAGHCVDPDTTIREKITVGTDNVATGGKDYEIEKVFPHPKFFLNDTMVDYDLSVVKLKKKLKFGDSVKSIQIADSNLPKSGELLEAMGFGKTESGKPSKILLKVNLPYVDRKSCQKMNDPFIISKQNLCAGVGDGRSCCHGDSGSPVLYKGKLIGLVSWGYNGICNLKGHPGGFAYVPSMKDFIGDVIKNN